MLDLETYRESTRILKENFKAIYKDTKATYVISISRKGPRLLEFLFKDGSVSLNNTNTLTEYGVPFLFHSLSGENNKNYRICIVDDAIYYGTTMERITREVQYFASLYGVKVTIEQYAAIKDKDASNRLDGVNAYENIREGYAHFFIKQLTSDIRNLNNTFEVEFPSVRYELGHVFTSDELYDTLQDVFGESNVYAIRHTESENFNVLLPNVNGTIFNKIRIYPDYEHNVLNIVGIAPRIVLNEEYNLRSLFVSTEVQDLWRQIFDHSALPEDINDSTREDYNQLVEARNRSLIIIANYILSFNTLVRQKSQIQQVLDHLDTEAKYCGVLSQHLFYLIADRQLSLKMKSALDMLYGAGTQLSVSGIVKSENLSSIVFSKPDAMAEDDILILDNQNRLMISKSQNLQEALSALTFNMSVLVEKRLRRIGYYDSHRLHFGYTFDAMLADVRRYALFDSLPNNKLMLHKWVDRRIDQGCLVPQYILTDEDCWLRVFRPGENEDAILSHLSRFVLFVFTCIDDSLRLGWVPKDMFGEVLGAVYHLIGDSVSSSLGIYFMLDVNKLYFFNDDQQKPRLVLDYLFDMHVFSYDDEKVRISPRLVDEELMRHTTLDKVVENDVKDKISMMLSDLKQASDIPLGQAFLVMNYYLYDVNDRSKAARAMHEAISQALSVSGEWMHDRTEYKDEITDRWNDVHLSYLQLMDYVMDTSYWLSVDKLQKLSPDILVQQQIVQEQCKMNSLILELELLLSTFLINDAPLTKNILDNILKSPAESYNISDSVFVATKRLLSDYNKEVVRTDFLKAVSIDLSNNLND